MLPNLRKLGLYISPEKNWKQQQLLLSLKHLTRLNTLKIHPGHKHDGPNGVTFPSLFQLEVGTFPSSITKITWTNIAGLSTDSMTTIANLTNLQILKLYGNNDVIYAVSQWYWDNDPFDLHIFVGWFLQLKVFQMRWLGVRNWELANGAMPFLQHLVINECKHLVSLPNELWSFIALRQVHILQPSQQLSSMLQNLEMKDGVKLIIE